MKLIDKFLKILKTDRNTFVAYIMLMITFFLIVDRAAEVLLIITNGVAYHYWGPIAYALSFLAPSFCFMFVVSSSFIKADEDKHGWFYAYAIELYTLAIFMVIEWTNKVVWFGIIRLPNFVHFVQDFSYLIKPALSSISVAIPLGSWVTLFNFLYKGVAQTKAKKDSICDFTGINLADLSKGWGEYTDELYLGISKDKGKKIKLCEEKRFEHVFVCGVTGSGKTTLMFEPWIAQDISKKAFYAQSSKALAFAGLRTGICTLKGPYSNEYLNKNFSLNMISPSDSKKKLFNSRVSNLIYAKSGNKVIYRNLGLTYIAADNESFAKIAKVCDCFNVSYNLIDPLNPDSVGLNPFANASPAKAAGSIITILKGIYPDELTKAFEVYQQNLISQIITNLAILLQVIYPKINDGKIPTLVDLMKLMSDFELIEKLCSILEINKDLSEEYSSEISFFKANFFKNSPNRSDMQKLVQVPIGLLQSLVRNPNLRSVLRNRTNNVDFDRSLEEGQVNLLLTRRGELGEGAHIALGLFYLLLMKSAVLSRPGTEKTRIPHYLYIDEAPSFINQSTEAMFTVYRKYRVGTIISAQSISQIKAKGDKLFNTVISNCANKFVFGNNAPEENDWWERVIGNKKQWVVTPGSYNAETMSYDTTKMSAKYGAKAAVDNGKIYDLKFKVCAYRIKGPKNKGENGQLKVDFLPEKYTKKQDFKEYDFAKFSNGIADSDIKNSNSSNKNDFVTDDEGPIKMNTSNLNFGFDSSDAIINKKHYGSSNKK